MKPTKELKFPIQAYDVVTHMSKYGPTIEVYEIEIVDYKDDFWSFKYVGKTIWQMTPRHVDSNDVINYAKDLSTFCFDPYSVKLRVDKVKQQYIVELKTLIKNNSDRMNALVKELSLCIQDDVRHKHNLELLETAVFSKESA